MRPPHVQCNSHTCRAESVHDTVAVNTVMNHLGIEKEAAEYEARFPNSQVVWDGLSRALGREGEGLEPPCVGSEPENL